MKGIVALSVLLTLGCGSEPLDPTDFELPGPWSGDFVAGLVSLGSVQMTLTPERDGAIEEYSGAGTLFSNRPFRFQQVRTDYDTTTGDVEMTILDFPVPVNVMVGSYNGTQITVSDSTFCICTLILSR